MDVVRPHGRFSLLIVNPDDEARRWLELVADESRLFWSIRSFADGRFALEHIWSCFSDPKHPVPDIMITDIRTAGLTGVQLTRELRRYEELHGMLLAFVVSSGGPREQDAAESAGCDYFIRRPQSVDELLAIFSQLAKRCTAKSTAPLRMLQ